MNRLNKIVISFVLPFFVLLFNVSYSREFSSTPLSNLGGITDSHVKVEDNFEIGGFTSAYIVDTIDNYLTNVEDEFFYNNFNSMIKELKKLNYFTIIGCSDLTNPASNYGFYIIKNIDVGYRSNDYGGKNYFSLIDNTATGEFYRSVNGGNIYSNTSIPYDGYFHLSPFGYIFYSNQNIKLLVLADGLIWDGTSYYYEVAEEPEEVTPSPPSNAEITQAVQAFYNSDYYKNNKDFEDFIVMYNYETKYFDFIGHNFGNKLGQQIIDAGISIGYPPVSYNERWWKYTLPDEFLTTLFNKYYWLYSTNDFGENIKYEGKGSINDLLDLHFATSSIIVYSTTDYPVNTVFKNDNDEMESTVELMPGDQYTYDENLDPTTNEYDPLTNFIPTDPIQDILNEADFSEIKNVFEENKNILNIEKASWLFTANNQLINYFISLLLLLIVFLLISRILGG